MLTQHIALVPESEGVNPSELARVSAALQRQVTRDVAPIWNVTATVDAFPYLEDVPLGYWPILLTFCDLGRQGGVHLDRRGQPYAQVRLAQHWSLAASRACLEMLVNPSGSRSVTAPSLRSEQGPVEFLVEACGACGDARNAYTINGVVVSDFCTPAYYGAESGQPGRYTFGSAASAPLQLLPGGHLSWYDPVTGSYWLRSHWSDNPVDTKLGELPGAGAPVREVLNACAPLRASSALRLPETLEARTHRAQRAAQVQAQRLRALLGSRLEDDLGAASEAVHRSALPKPRPATEPEATETPVQDAELVIESLDAACQPSADSPAEYTPIDSDELQEILPASAAAPAPAPSLSPSPAPALTTPSSASPPPLPTADAPRRNQIPSLTPVSLASVARAEPRRSKAPLYATIALAALFAAAWIGNATKRAPARHAAAAGSPVQAPRVAAPPPMAAPPPPAAPAPIAAPPPAVTPAPAVAAPAPVAAPTPPAPREKAIKPRSGAAAAKPARAAAAPRPPEPSPAPAAVPTSIDDLFETRK